MWETVLTNVLIAVATAVVGVIGKAVTDWSKREKEKAELNKEAQAKVDAIEAIKIGVAKTQTDFVEDIKRASTDGKLSRDEIEQARDKAAKTALETVTGPAMDWLNQLTTNAFNGLIDKVVQDRK